MSKEVEKAKKYLRMMNNSIDSDMYANEPIETILKYIEELEKEKGGRRKRVIPKQKIWIALKYENKQEFFIELGSYIKKDAIRFTKFYSEDELEIKLNGIWQEVKHNNYILINESDNNDVLITDVIENYIELKEVENTNNI